LGIGFHARGGVGVRLASVSPVTARHPVRWLLETTSLSLKKAIDHIKIRLE
jgi:hypothetical protein